MCDIRVLIVKGIMYDLLNGNILYSLISILGLFRCEMIFVSVFNLFLI